MEGEDMATFRDKLIGLALVVVGLAFIAEMHPTDATLLLGGLVVLGGIGSIVNAQVLAAAIKTIEKATGIGPSAAAAIAAAAKTDQETGA
jgi:hypothetical protein